MGGDFKKGVNNELICMVVFNSNRVVYNLFCCFSLLTVVSSLS